MAILINTIKHPIKHSNLINTDTDINIVTHPNFISCLIQMPLDILDIIMAIIFDRNNNAIKVFNQIPIFFAIYFMSERLNSVGGRYIPIKLLYTMPANQWAITNDILRSDKCTEAEYVYMHQNIPKYIRNMIFSKVKKIQLDSYRYIPAVKQVIITVAIYLFTMMAITNLKSASTCEKIAFATISTFVIISMFFLNPVRGIISKMHYEYILETGHSLHNW